MRAKILWMAALACIFMFFNVFMARDLCAQQKEQKFQGFDLQGYTDEGEKSWDIRGDTADVSGQDIQLTNVDANSYGEQKMNVTAEKGTINQLNGNMLLKDYVVVTSEEGSQLMTDSLNWDKEKDLVTTEDDVYIEDDKFTLTGQGMESQPGLKKAKILKNVAVRIDPESSGETRGSQSKVNDLSAADENEKENKKITITSDGPMVVDQSKSVATFQQNVVAVQEGQILKADLMEVYFDQNMSGIKEMICIGNVEIIKGDNRSYAEKAVYNAKDQQLRLSGRPKLILITEGENAITSFGN